MKNKILVLTPTLGNRETIGRTISCVNSIGKDYVEHVIVAPNEKLPFLKEKYPNIRYLPEPENCRSIYEAINYAFNKLGKEYEYLTFINDDDYWLTDFSILIETIMRDSSIFLVYGKTIYINNECKKIGEQTSSSQFYHFASLLMSNIILLTQQATIIKSELFFLQGGFDERFKLAADTKFWVDLSLKRIRYKYVNKSCAAYMIQEGQLSSNKKLQEYEHKQLVSMYSKYVNKNRFLILLSYRLINIPIYLKRLYKTKRMNNPFSVKNI